MALARQKWNTSFISHSVWLKVKEASEKWFDLFFFFSFLKYSGPVVRVYGNHIWHLLKPHFCIHNFLIWNSLGSWRGLMPREGRVYCQYLEFIIWEELPLPSPCRKVSSGAHPRSFGSLLGGLKSQEMKQCHKVQNQGGENSRRIPEQSWGN